MANQGNGSAFFNFDAMRSNIEMKIRDDIGHSMVNNNDNLWIKLISQTLTGPIKKINIDNINDCSYIVTPNGYHTIITSLLSNKNVNMLPHGIGTGKGGYGPYARFIINIINNVCGYVFSIERILIMIYQYNVYILILNINIE